MKQEVAETTTGTRKRRISKSFSAREKTQAVLALWSGRRNTSTLMRVMEVPWAVIHSWEKRALSGMLTALDPTWKKEEEGQPNLPRRLEELIDQTVKPSLPMESAASK